MSEASCRAALRCRPDFPEAHNSLGLVLRDLGRAAEAEASSTVPLPLRLIPPELESAPDSVRYPLSVTASFAYDAVGDVHLTWENEALRETQDSKGDLEVVYPPVSIHAEPSVAWVDANVSSHKTADESKAYLEFLYTDQAQETLAKYGYRPINQNILDKHVDRLPAIPLFPITLIAKNWEDAQAKFFAENAIFDIIYRPTNK